MADEFRDCFVGEKGYDALKKLMKSGNEFCTDVAKCLQERSDAETAYVKALRKNSDNLAKLASRAKGSLAQAFTTLATQTSKESEAHNDIANTLFNDISIPMKNLAETQAKSRKSIEDTINGKFKEWNSQKEKDYKYRSCQFDKSKEIEALSLKMSEASSTTKSSARSKANSVSTPLVMSCVLPGGRNASEKLEASMKNTEEELEKIDRKYHLSTRNVELLRQACDTEMYRTCDQMQKMELERITEMANFIRTYANSVQTLSETMNQVSQELYSIKVLPSNDIVVHVRSNVQPMETEILLYDIYAENEDHVMNDTRRILSLMHWMETLKRDIEIQRQTRNAIISSRPSHKSNEGESPDDDRGSSNDGAMCSKSSRSKKDIVRNSVHQDDSSSSSNDDDGAMHHTKREKKKKEGSEVFSSDIFVDRRGAVLLEELYRASLYKIESVYNRIKRLPELKYEHAQRLTRTYTDKGCLTTFLRLPCQPSGNTPPSAPPATKYFVQAMPIFVPTDMQQQPMAYSTQRQAPPPGWAISEMQSGPAVPDDRMGPSGPVYPTFMAQAPPTNRAKALYSYVAKRKDELDIEPGDVIEILERREDEWFKGKLKGRTGLFPGNFVQEF